MSIAVAQETCDPATGGMTGSGTTFASSSITVAAGSILVAVACGVNGGGTATTTSFTDSINGALGWSTVKNVANSPLLLSAGWRYFATGQTVVVTATYNASCSQRGIKLLEVTGGMASGVLDGTPAGQFQLNVGTGADLITSGNFTVTFPPALVIAASMNYGNNKNPAAGTGFTSTRVDWNTDVGGCRIEYVRTAGGGTLAGTFTGPSIDSWLTMSFAFDEAAAGSLTAQPTAQEAVKGAPPRRPPPDSANPLPATKGSPWVFVEPPRIVRPRRQDAACANPLPPLAAVAAVSFAPSGQVDRRAPPAVRPQSADPIPAARISPWFQENAPPPARAPQRQRAETAAPVPSFVRLGAPVDPPLVPRFIKRLINLVYQVIGLPAVFIPVNTQVVRPQLVAKVDDLDLVVGNTQLGNVVASGSTDLTLAGDT